MGDSIRTAFRRYLSGAGFCLILLISVMLLSGCSARVGSHIQPSAVPQKWVTKTAVPPAAQPTVSLPGADADPWQECAAVIVSGTLPHRVSGIENEEFRRRVQITFMIQDQEAENAFIAERCMNGKLYVCRIDGLHNCAEKLDFTMEPNEAMRLYCADEAKDGAILSPVITGINSAFEWRCHEGTAVITAQIAEPDADGYDRSIWYEIPDPL